MFFENSNNNLIEGNDFYSARHTLLVLSCSNYNVVRNNTFNNPIQKIGEIFDCEGVIESLYDDTLQVRRLNATKRNIWEKNRFVYTRDSSQSWMYNAIQYAGQNGIVRRNVFYDNEGGGAHLQVYSDEALYNYGNHIYHNTLYNNSCYALSASGSSDSRYHNNFIVNNLLYNNYDCNGVGNQINLGNQNAVSWSNNPTLTENPSFVDIAGRNFNLNSISSAIDSGTFLTNTSGSGSGTSMPVQDVLYFYDGYDIVGEQGDLIQLENGGTARIVDIDYTTNTLILDRSLTWSNGQGVSLVYSGNAPDIGAYEYSGGSVGTESISKSSSIFSAIWNWIKGVLIK